MRQPDRPEPSVPHVLWTYGREKLDPIPLTGGSGSRALCQSEIGPRPSGEDGPCVQVDGQQPGSCICLVRARRDDRDP